MSKYTTEVRFICETAAGLEDSKGYNDVESIISASRTSIFDFSYPIFDNAYKSVLESKILRHYYTREIGLETVGLWKHFLNMRMNEIMPYYNKMYESNALVFNPLYTVDYTLTHEGSASGTINEDIDDTRGNDRTFNNSTMDKFSDTPQGAVTNLENGTYLTTARQITNGGTDNIDEDYNRDRDVETSSTDEYLRRIYGNNGKSFSELLKEYRSTFINIDMMIINDLNDLFMGVW